MPTIAELTIKVNTTDLDKAKKSLDDLAKAAGGLGDATLPTFVPPEEPKKVRDLSAAIDDQRRKLKAIENQRKALRDSDLSSTNPQEYTRLNQVLDTRVEIINRQGNALDRLYREEQKITEQKVRRQAQIVSAQNTEQAAIDATLSKLSTRYKAEIEYQRTLDTLNKARVTQGMTDGSKGISGEEYNQYVKLAQARRDAAVAKDAETKATLAAKSVRDAEKLSLEQEAAQIERLIALKRQEIQAEKSSSGSGGVRSTNTKQAEAELESYIQKLEQVRLRQSVTESSAEKMAQEFLQLKYSIDPTAKSLDALARKQDDLNKVFRANFIDEAEWKRLSGLIDKSRNSLLGLESSVDGVGDEFVKLRAQIDPAAAALEKVNVQQAKLNALYNSGKGSLPTAEYERLNTILAQNRKRIADLSATTGKTAKEINFAMRGLPAQFTDIFVSLQGGQAPLTVLLQQGGQIKDMFGGVGPALKAMGGYILGLINPLTIGAAALGTFAAGMYLGGKEAQNFNKAIQETGNESGTSVANLNSLASSLGSVVGTTGKAAKTLTEVAAAGNIASTSFETVTKAAIAWEKATGTATEETIAKFSEINKGPVKAIEELNDKMNFLTADVYKQILAFEDQGDAASAASLAEFEYARALEERSSNITDNLGIVERAWGGVAAAAKRGWDAILDIGRKETFEDRLDKISRQIELARRNTVSRWQEETGQIFSQASLDQQWEDEWQKEQDRAQEQWVQTLEESNERRKIALIKTTNDLIDSARTNKEKLEQELKLYNQEVASSMGAISEEEAEAARAAIRKKYEGKGDLKPQKVAKERQSEADRLLSTILQQGAALQNQLSTQEKVLSEENKLEKLKERIRIAEQAAAQGSATVDQKSLITRKEELLAAQQLNVETQKSIAAEQEKVRLKNLQVSLDAKLATNQQKYADRILGAGMGDTERERMRERLSLQQEYNRELDKLTRSRNEEKIGQSEYDKSTAALKDNLRQQKEALEQNYRDIDAAQSNWVNGANRAWDNYLATGKDVAGLTENLFTSTFNNMEDALVGFVTTGKLSFTDLTISILSDLAKMATKIATNQILMGIFGSFSWGISGGLSSSATINTGSSFAGYAAKGRAYDSGVQFFAKGGAFTNSVVNKPTAFGTGSGLGIMGEAGPEAIMPLTRTSDGQLGVKAAGGGGSTVVAPVSVTVSVSDSGAGSNSPSNNTEQQGRAVQMAIKSEVEKTIQIGLQPGGMIWRSLNNR